ncbi:MAG: PKD domain-containing protein [Armatimonadetes bacterium]|nr:PKD domain-containing protein [Armatimonadota bacterium]
MKTALLAAALASFAAAQSAVVLPNGCANTEGNSATSFPFGYGNKQIRVQHIFDSTHFTGQGIYSPILINQLRFRANGANASPGYVYDNVCVRMSAAAVDYLAPSTTFANNHGTNLTTVHSGAVTVANGTGTTPNNWYVTIPCTRFFWYDPNAGADLCLEVAHDGSGPTATSGPSHDGQTTNSYASRVFSTDWTSPTGTAQLNYGIVVEFGYTSSAGLYPNFVSDRTGGPSPLTVNFTDTSYSSAPFGVITRAWDFDGDNVIDSTAQNPTFTYQNCGDYDVALTVTDGMHPPTTLRRTAYIQTDHIVADFMPQVTGLLTVQFHDRSNMPATSWQWDLDGDNVIDSTVQNPVWTYLSPDPVNVTLSAVRLCGPWSTVTKQIVPLQVISHNVSPNSGLSSGASVYFDIDVSNPYGIFFDEMDVFSSDLNTPFTVDVYVKQGSHRSFEGTAAEWVLAGTASGTSASASTLPSRAAFPRALYLPPGQFGIKLLYNGIGPRCRGIAATATVRTWDLGMTLGVSRSTTVADPWGGTTTDRSAWSGTLHYSTNNVTGLAGLGSFGPGCPSSLGVSHVSGNPPRLGTTCNLTFDNVPWVAGLVLLSFDNRWWGSQRLPLDLTSYGMPGCFLRTDILSVAFVLHANNTIAWQLTVPSDPSLSGLFLFAQALLLAPGVNSHELVMSDAAAMILGN